MPSSLKCRSLRISEFVFSVFSLFSFIGAWFFQFWRKCLHKIRNAVAATAGTCPLPRCIRHPIQDEAGVCRHFAGRAVRLRRRGRFRRRRRYAIRADGLRVCLHQRPRIKPAHSLVFVTVFMKTKKTVFPRRCPNKGFWLGSFSTSAVPI